MVQMDVYSGLAARLVLVQVWCHVNAETPRPICIVLSNFTTV